MQSRLGELGLQSIDVDGAGDCFFRSVSHQLYGNSNHEGGVRVCGIAVLGYFCCGVAVIFISKYGIAVYRVQAVCGKFKFYVAVVGEKIVVSR